MDVPDAGRQFLKQRPVDVPGDPADARVGAAAPFSDGAALLELAGTSLDALHGVFARSPDRAGSALADPAHRVRNVGRQRD